MCRRLAEKQRRVHKGSDNPLRDLSAQSLAGVVQSVSLDQSKTREQGYFYSSNLP